MDRKKAANAREYAAILQMHEVFFLFFLLFPRFHGDPLSFLRILNKVFKKNGVCILVELIDRTNRMHSTI